MVSIPRLLIIAERGYCDSDAHWLRQLDRILGTLTCRPTVGLQIRNKYDAKSWAIVAPHIARWMGSYPNQSLLNGFIFPTIDCARHFPEAQLQAVTEKRTFLRGGSIHSVSAVETATRVGCDYVQYGAVFPTSKPVVPTGVNALRSICEVSTIPVLAVGGISTGRQICQCLLAGAYGISIGSWIMQAQSPVTVIDQILEEISQFMSNL